MEFEIVTSADFPHGLKCECGRVIGIGQSYVSHYDYMAEDGTPVMARACVYCSSTRP